MSNLAVFWYAFGSLMLIGVLWLYETFGFWTGSWMTCTVFSALAMVAWGVLN